MKFFKRLFSPNKSPQKIKFIGEGGWGSLIPEEIDLIINGNKTAHQKIIDELWSGLTR